MGASARAPSTAALAAGGDMFLARAIAARPQLAMQLLLLLLLVCGATNSLVDSVAGASSTPTLVAWAAAVTCVTTAIVVGIVCAPLHVLPDRVLAALAPAMAAAAVAQAYAHGGAALTEEERCTAVDTLAARWRAAPFARRAAARQAAASWARQEEWAALCRDGPVLLLTGWVDTVAPPASMAALAHAMTGTEAEQRVPQQKMVSNAGHMLMEEQSDAVNSSLEAFLRSTVIEARERALEKAQAELSLSKLTKKVQ